MAAPRAAKACSWRAVEQRAWNSERWVQRAPVVSKDDGGREEERARDWAESVARVWPSENRRLPLSPDIAPVACTPHSPVYTLLQLSPARAGSDRSRRASSSLRTLVQPPNIQLMLILTCFRSAVQSGPVIALLPRRLLPQLSADTSCFASQPLALAIVPSL